MVRSPHLYYGGCHEEQLNLIHALAEVELEHAPIEANSVRAPISDGLISSTIVNDEQRNLQNIVSALFFERITRDDVDSSSFLDMIDASKLKGEITQLFDAFTFYRNEQRIVKISS